MSRRRVSIAEARLCDILKLFHGFDTEWNLNWRKYSALAVVQTGQVPKNQYDSTKEEINHKSASLTTECLQAWDILSTIALFFGTPLTDYR